MTAPARCECCLEFRPDVYNVMRTGARTAVDDFKVVGYFDLCIDCEENCPAGIGWCARGRCLECGARQSWFEAKEIVGTCQPCADVAWAFGWKYETEPLTFSGAVRLSLKAINERGKA